EACGISTLSQSPMLGFHKQMDNRIKLLEEILSFRMQGVEFDNGDMYVDGHKAASDVRDEFVSVTEKLMDELAQCYNVLPQLDRPVSSWKALNLRKTLLMASSVRLKPLNCSRLPCVYAQETLTFLLTQKKTCVKNYVQK